jgi:hypothetical protein
MLAILAIEIPMVAAFDSAVIRARFQHASPKGLPRSLIRPVSGQTVFFGIFDESGILTSLQLQVSLASALGIDERRVLVEFVGDRVFHVRIRDEGEALARIINEAVFLDTLASQPLLHGSRVFLSELAAVKNTTTTGAVGLVHKRVS